MNITLIYKERFETSYRHLAEYLKDEYNYKVIELSEVLRYHISNKTELGEVCSNYLNLGRTVPDSVFHEIFKSEIEKSNLRNIAIKGYPNSKVQIQLFKQLCETNNYLIKNIWYLKGINTIRNILANPKYSLIFEKYESKEYAEKQIMRSRQNIESNLEELKLGEKIILFESEALGINFKDDKLRIKELMENSFNSNVN